MLADASGGNLLVLLFESGCIREYCWLSWFVVCAILLPIAVTFYITWWFIRFFDGFFSPIYEYLGFHVIGLGFVTSFVFIFLVGVFVSSWIGASVLSVGEWFIKRMHATREAHLLRF
ncbi:hypothetical protein M758_8G048600 [Ceratodon purpureus]|nr:hypothetical protein M758_8G048600 [Ceratodon purpureus]